MQREKVKVKLHEMECEAEACEGIALPRTSYCRLHYLKEYMREQRKFNLEQTMARLREDAISETRPFFWIDYDDAGSDGDDDVGDHE